MLEVNKNPDISVSTSRTCNYKCLPFPHVLALRIFGRYDILDEHPLPIGQPAPLMPSWVTDSILIEIYLHETLLSLHLGFLSLSINVIIRLIVVTREWASSLFTCIEKTI